MKSKSIFSKFISLCCICGFFLIAFVLAEIYLRYRKDVLPLNLRNIILTKYNKRPDGIYYKDKRWNINIMKPNFKQEFFYNDYRWLHQSNEIGIRRSKNIEKADIIALGDSFIYGHGVPAENTLCNYLESISNKRVVNLGVQGDYPPSQYIRLKYLGLFLRPKIVLFFMNFPQDGSDFLMYRPKQEYISSIVLIPPRTILKM